MAILRECSRRSVKRPRRISQSAFSSLLTIFEIISSQDWEAFRQLVLSNPKSFAKLSQLLHQCEEFGKTFLHSCLENDPPLDVVEEMAQLYPEAVHSVDLCGRTPLHIGAMSSARLSVMTALISCYPGACLIKDQDGKLPLHYACDKPTLQSTADGGDEEYYDEDTCFGGADFHIVKALLAAAPSSSLVEDDDLMVADEYASISSAFQIVTLIQNAAREELSRMKEESEKTRRRSWENQVIVLSPAA